MIMHKLMLILAIAALNGCTQNDCPAIQPVTTVKEQIPPPKIPASTPSSVADARFDAVEFQKISDLRARLEEVSTADSGKLATTIAELDGWLFAEADEAEARTLMSGALVKLRSVVAKDVRDSLQAAKKAPDPAQRSTALRKAEAILGLFPTPRDASSQAELDGLVSSIKSTSAYLQDVQRLRFNQWALDQIKESIQQYHKAKVILMNDQDRRTLIKISHNFLGPINPGFLEPAVANLYQYSLGLTQASLKGKEDLLLDLAKGLTSPTLVRKSPMDF